MVIFGCQGNKNLDTDLTILKNEFPKAFFFRQTEGIDRYLDYQAWENEFDGLMGIMGKALQEEKAVLTNKSVAYYTQFKKNHPEKLVLLHYNGNARDVRYESGEFFDGHWLYHNGTKIAGDLPEEWNYSKVKVEDASLFKEYTGRFFDRKEDVAIVRMDENEKPDWSYCEQAIIRDIDYENNILTIARAQFNSSAKSFEKGKAMIAAHVIEGPWNGPQNNIMWYYNHSTACPKDAQGRNCSDVLSEYIANKFKPGGDLHHYDGIELDVLFRTLFYPSYGYLQDWGAGKKLEPDCNGDGVGDMGIIDGVNTYEKGVAEFVRKTRKKLDLVRPGILFMADAGYKTQRSSADVMYRVFEKGLVITNPGLQDYTFDLSKIAPGNSYRRIKGTVYQDRETNNGKPVGDRITLGKHDALFLIKE